MVNLLRSEGHDVLTSYEAGQANQGIPDDVVLQYATATSRILITENRQDFIDLHRTAPNHAGMIIFKHDRDYAGKVKAIIDFLDEDSRTVLESFVAGYEAKYKSSRTDFFRTRVW
jgi:predicted nuclease of predicted toxin-antitoxin system